MLQQMLYHLVGVLKQNYRAALAGMGTTVLVLWGTVWFVFSVYDIHMRELTEFFLTQKEQRARLAEQLKAINRKVDAAETESHDNQQELVKIIQSFLQNGSQFNNKVHDDKAPWFVENDQQFRKLINISAENQDIIRALMEFGRIYAKLVESNEQDEDTHRHLSNLYQALLEITLDDPLDEEASFNKKETRARALKEKKSVCEMDRRYPICKAKARLEGVERNISDFPESVKDEVEIEVLRYLSYCAARALEINHQIAYTKRAEAIMDRQGHLDPEPYRRKYYWIDYSRLVNAVKGAKPGYEEVAYRYFDRLQQHLATEGDFLRFKLIQHKGLMIDQKQKEYWTSLISRAAP